MSKLKKKRFTTFTEEEELAEQVKGFRCLFDKTAKNRWKKMFLEIRGQKWSL